MSTHSISNYIFKLSMKQIEDAKPCSIFDLYVSDLKQRASYNKGEFTIEDAIAVNVETEHLLWAAALLAPHDQYMRKCLIGFINDCSVAALPAIRCTEAREAVEEMVKANRDYFVGDINFDTWIESANRGNRGLASEFAPEVQVVDGRWIRPVNGTWYDLQDFDYGEWARWAPFCHAISLKLWSRADRWRHGCDAVEDEKDILIRWLSGSANNIPKGIPENVPPAKGRSSNVCNHAELYWYSLCFLPLDAISIEGVYLDKNACLSIPEGVEEIGEIVYGFMNSHVIGGGELSLPSSLKLIGRFDPGDEGGNLHVPDSIEFFGEISIADGTAVSAPTLKFCRVLKLDQYCKVLDNKNVHDSASCHTDQSRIDLSRLEAIGELFTFQMFSVLPKSLSRIEHLIFDGSHNFEFEPMLIYSFRNMSIGKISFRNCNEWSSEDGAYVRLIGNISVDEEIVAPNKMSVRFELF